MMILKSVFIIVMAVTLIGIISIPNVSADVMCIQQVVWTPQDSDYGIELCEQDDLWDEVNAIWDYLGMNVGVSNTNTDTVSINLSDVEDLDGSYIIDQDGKIDLPFVGKIKIDGLSLDQAQQVLFKKIEEYYKNPDLQITVEEYNSSKSYIVGAVTTQTTLNLNQEPVRLIEAAIKAGFNPSSGNKNFGTKGILRRDNKVFKINLENAFKNLDDKENFYLKKNDVIFIDRNSDTIHVFGEVSKPGIYYPNLGYSLTELVSTSGLNQLTANAKKIYVIRENYDKFLSVSVFQLDIENPINLIVGRKFNLQSKDIVYIPASGIVKWNRTISLLLPQTDLFKSYNPIINNGLQTYEEP